MVLIVIEWFLGYAEGWQSKVYVCELSVNRILDNFCTSIFYPRRLIHSLGSVLKQSRVPISTIYATTPDMEGDYFYSN